ncbi:hypothetical protein HL670_03730 [Serratia plymuthica]|uniref:DUF943 family protein n=1 Tax=Serratia plymuthica TaxID=82996 RepID=UPI000786C8A0|nr:DUF943 family protein [Serratia plymuthica]QJW56833.1 hypothetical protein HL670_03730 [Serratia plymuthica]
MKAKNKKILFVLMLAVCAPSGYFLWLSQRTVEIIAVHQRHEISSILVNNFPFTDRGRIAWWFKNKDMLKNRYGAPRPDRDGSFTIIFWNFGDGYKEEGKSDRLCFENMKAVKNCIEKERYMTIYKFNNEEPFFSFDGKRYIANAKGEIVKIKDE